MMTLLRCVAVVLVLCACAWAQETPPKGDAAIDFGQAQELFRKQQGGGKLSEAEAAYLARAKAARAAAQKAENKSGKKDRESAPTGGKDKVGLKPLTEMSADDRYKGQDGGLYGEGKNEPPAEHREAAQAALAKIQPLDPAGRPSGDGQIGFVSISMSNATMEFSTFKRLADADAGKSARVAIVDCAQGGQAMAEWVDPQAAPWKEASRRLAAANVAPEQVQVAWIKLANKGPRGDLDEHGPKLENDTLAVIHNCR